MIIMFSFLTTLCLLLAEFVARADSTVSSEELFSVMDNLTDWLMVVITFLYLVATVYICYYNYKSAKYSREAVEESKKQFKKSIELQKQHNYDSVRPAVTIDYSSTGSMDGSTFRGSIAITNHGLGTAVIKELKFKKNNKEYKNTNGYCTFYDLIRFRIFEEQEDLSPKSIISYHWTKEFRNESDNMDFLAVGEKLVLLEFDTRNRENAEIVGKLFHGVYIELVYTDIYNSCDWTVTNRLSYFKPNWVENRRVNGLDDKQ